LFPTASRPFLALSLLAGNDLRNLSPAFLAILANREIIAVNQDKDDKQDRQVRKSGDAEVWTRPLSGGAQAIALFSCGAETAKITIS
jgi:alpha-galactosidase